MKATNHPLTQKQISLFWALLRKRCPSGSDATEFKELLINQYTHGRTTSLREMEQYELHDFLRDHKQQLSSSSSRAERIVWAMRWKVAFTLRDKGYIDASKGGESLWREADRIVLNRFKKAFTTPPTARYVRSWG